MSDSTVHVLGAHALTSSLWLWFAHTATRCAHSELSGARDETLKTNGPHLAPWALHQHFFFLSATPGCFLSLGWLRSLMVNTFPSFYGAGCFCVAASG